MLLASYGLRGLLEVSDITEEAVVEILIDARLIKLEDYFEDD